jgi:hypothetical protein
MSTKRSIKKIGKLLQQRQQIDKKVQLLGEEMYGEYFELAVLEHNEDIGVSYVRTYCECGHDWESDEELFSLDGIEVE